MTKKLISTVIVACSLGGAAAGAFLLAPGQAIAQDGTTALEQAAPGDATTESDSDTTESDSDTTESDKEDGFEDRVKEALQGLVDDGTLTEAQVDAVVTALDEARPEGRHGKGARHGKLGKGGDIASILGVTESELKDALMNGDSIAGIATEQGVDVQDVIDAIVAATTEKVNAAVEAERIDQERADEILANATERATSFVNGELERPTRQRGQRGGSRLSST